MPTAQDIPEGYRRIEGSERRPSPGAQLLGPADPAETLTVTIVLRRRLGGPPVPDPSYFTKTPFGQRQRMPENEFTAKYGASPTDIARVTEFAQGQGLTVVETNAARRSVVVSGTVSQMSQAFAVTLGRYQHTVVRRRHEGPRTETYRGRDGFIHVPTGLAEIIVGVFGLDNRRITKCGADDPPNTTTITIPQVRGLYQFPTNSAAGQTIAIFSEAGYQTSDITNYFATLPPGYPKPTITDISVDASNDGTEDLETTQDICIAATAAPGADIAVYFTSYSQQGWVDLINRVVHPNAGDPQCSVLSSSFGVSNADDPNGLMSEGISISWLTAVHMALQDAAMQAVTVCIYSGDQGTDCTIGDGSAHVIYPASDPYVLAVGGTTVGNIMGSSFDEYVWNDTFNVPGFNPSGATGGGVSDLFTSTSSYANEFAYQASAEVPPSVNDGHFGRGVPDVAANASPNSGYPLNLADAAAQGLQNPIPVSGTSASTPLWAGFIAVVNAALGANVGYVNPLLYAIAPVGFRNIVGPPGPANNSFNGVTGYPASSGWNACTGWGSMQGEELLAAIQAFYAKSVTFALDRDHYGQDETDALRTQPGGAVYKGAFFVIVDGFTPPQLGITGASSLAAAPVVTFSPSTGVTSPAACSSLESDDPSFGPEVQRFRFGYDVNFGNDDSAFTSFTGDSETVTLNTTYQDIPASAQVQFIKQPDPYILQGPQTWWLSNDIRLIQVADGGSAFGVTMGNDPFAFLSSLTSALQAGQGMAGGESFDTNTQEDTEVLTVAPQNSAGQNVYNFAIARVHYQALSSQAQSVRVFFRLFAANSTATDFQPDTTYRRYAAYSPAYPVPAADDFQNVLPELGVLAGEYVTIPCFGEPRQNPTQSGAADTLPSLQTPDTPNVNNLPPTGGPVRDYFYGCWLDINQTGAGTTSMMPAMPPSGNEDGPWPGLTLEPIQQAFIANEHTCIVAEIAFDPVAINTGTAPFNSDKLAQRNISWSYVANPGVEASRRALEPFEIRPTPAELAMGEPPDELMIDWNNVPVGQTARIYLPAVDVKAVIAKAAELYRVERLTVVDPHTIGCTTGGVTYVPLPQGSGNGANFTGLMSVDLPLGIRRGQSFTVLVRQLTNASGRAAPPPPPPPQIGSPAGAAVPSRGTLLQWRRVLGTFQVNIPVSTKEILLPREEQRLSIFRWIGEAMPPQRRWYPVFQRYLQAIAERVQALGGDPTKILPSPTGEGRLEAPLPEERRMALTGKIAGLIFDRFGDFEGFLLDTEDGEHRFLSRERDVEALAERVWRERLRLTVRVAPDEPHRALNVIVHEPPAIFSH
jgi:Pro-kumamolisin, activation domain/Subtilase family